MPLLKEILPGIRAKHGTQVDVAKKLGIKSQLLGQYEKGKRNPKLGFYKKWEEVFGDNLQALTEANVSREAKNSTYVEIHSNNPVNEMDAKETFYRDLIEGNDEYSLMPRAVLKDYKIVPERILDVIIKSADSEKQALIEKHELIIEGLKNKINRLESEKEELQRQIPAKNKS